jgi:glutamate racemase
LAEGGNETPAAEPSVEELIEQIRNIEVGQFLLSTVSTLASLTYAKLEAKALDQAQTGIEALGALIPVLEGQIEAETARDLRAALANLQLAYADASG